MPEGILLAAKVNNQMTVFRCCWHAKKLGVKEGSSLTLAKACVPEAIVADYDPILDFKALYKLSVWSHGYSPLNGLDAEAVEAYKQKKLLGLASDHFGINLDITGMERVHKAEWSLVRRIARKTSDAGFNARIGVATTLGAAWALARYAREPLYIHHGPLMAALCVLPIDGLRLQPSVLTSLHEVGINTIGKLSIVPRRSIVKRYGTGTMRRLDEALGEVPEQVTAVPMPNHWSVFREFEYAINNHEKIVQAVLELLEELVGKLADSFRSAKYFILLLQGEDVWGIAYRTQHEFSLLIASDNGKHVSGVLYSLIERITLPGPVYVLGLTTRDTEKIKSQQSDLGGQAKCYAATAELINQLAVEVGAKNVCEASFTQEYLPEKSFNFLPVGQGFGKTNERCDLQGRPSKLLDFPEPVNTLAQIPDSPPVRIIWKGRDLKVIKAIGPERIAVPWFAVAEAEIVSRDYFKIEDETGRWLWIFKNSQTQQWFVHGLWV